MDHIRRWRAVTIRLPPDEYERFFRDMARSTCKKMSQYGRKILTRRPVTMFYRNASFDDFTAEAILLRKEFQAILEKGSLSASDKESLFKIIGQIKQTIIQIADICLQK